MQLGRELQSDAGIGFGKNAQRQASDGLVIGLARDLPVDAAEQRHLIEVADMIRSWRCRLAAAGPAG